MFGLQDAVIIELFIIIALSLALGVVIHEKRR